MCIHIRSINNIIIFYIMTNTVNYKKVQWDIVLFYIALFLISMYFGNHVRKDILELFNNNDIKTEYKIELVDQDSINVYSISNDTVYKGTVEEFHEIVHIDNL